MTVCRMYVLLERQPGHDSVWNVCNVGKGRNVCKVGKASMPWQCVERTSMYCWKDSRALAVSGMCVLLER
jgi:hypothetical protein